MNKKNLFETFEKNVISNANSLIGGALVEVNGAIELTRRKEDCNTSPDDKDDKTSGWRRDSEAEYDTTRAEDMCNASLSISIENDVK